MIMTNTIQISLTDFVDFMCKAGTKKISQVKAIKRNLDSPYSPAKDFYKPLREGIISFHKFNKEPSALDAISTVITDKKKQTAYPIIIAGYRRFLGGKDITWVKSPRGNLWTYRNLAIKANPELCLAFDGNEHIIKLYFKKDRLSRNHALCINHLMQNDFRNRDTGEIFGVLDVRSGRLIEELPGNGEFARFVKEEANRFLSLYNSV